MSIESRECERKAGRSGGAAKTAVWRVPRACSFAERTPGAGGSGAQSWGCICSGWRPEALGWGALESSFIL